MGSRSTRPVLRSDCTRLTGTVIQKEHYIHTLQHIYPWPWLGSPQQSPGAILCRGFCRCTRQVLRQTGLALSSHRLTAATQDTAVTSCLPRRHWSRTWRRGPRRNARPSTFTFKFTYWPFLLYSGSQPLLFLSYSSLIYCTALG